MKRCFRLYEAVRISDKTHLAMAIQDYQTKRKNRGENCILHKQLMLFETIKRDKKNSHTNKLFMFIWLIINLLNDLPIVSIPLH